MNNKYKAAVDKLMSMKGSVDENILKGLYSIANIQENDYIDRRDDLTQGTEFSNLSNEEFMMHFNKNKFNNYTEDKLKHLFQEMHNRYMAKNGYEVTRNVLVKKEPMESAYGFVNPDDDLLFINKSAIDKAKNVSLHHSLNQNTLGHCMFYVISHESQHVVQIEKILDNVLSKKQNEDDAFLSTLFAIENINFCIDESKDVSTFTDKWLFNYDFQYIEHNANFAAYQNYKQMVSDEYKLEQTNKFITNISLRADDVKVEERIAQMEKFAKFEIDYFNENVQDCELKQKYMKIINDYMKVDKNGKSKFRSKLEKEIGELVELQQSIKDNNNDNKVSKRKRFADEECGFIL